MGKIELSSAVSIALKQLRPTQRKKIEQEIKKQLISEKNAVLNMKKEIAMEKERNEREQMVLREKFDKEQSVYRKDKDALTAERKAIKSQSEEIAALRKDLESKNRMFDAEMNKETQRMNAQKKKLENKESNTRKQKVMFA